MRRTSLWSAAALAVLAVAAPAQTPSSAITAAVADSGRPAADTARDPERKPAQVLAFAGVKAGDKVADLIPGGGYFTRIFAKIVGPSGKVYAVVPTQMAARPGAVDGLKAIGPNVVVATGDIATMKAPEPLDLVWTSENYHDFHNAPNADLVALNKNVFAALKPGGVYMIEDHSAPGSDIGVTKSLHRIDPATVIKEVEAAGFKLEGRSQLLANPADAHDKPVFDASIKGKTDKFLLKFRKPK